MEKIIACIDYLEGEEIIMLRINKVFSPHAPGGDPRR